MSIRWLLCLSLFAASCRQAAAVSEDGGGRDISIALFSTHLVRSVTIAPVAANAWTSRCAHCTRTPLAEPFHVAGTIDVFAGGALRVTEDATGATRTATGLWKIRPARVDGTADVVLTLPSERYVMAVLNAEAASDEPAQSLRALAILARTYALNGKHFTAPPGHLTADLCDSTECQAMRMQPASDLIDDAVRSTAGETLWFGSRRAEVFFSQNCGGITEDAGAVWPQLHGLPYLHSHVDPYCIRRSKAAWHSEIPLKTFADIAQNEGWHLPDRIVDAQIKERSPSHRALIIQLTGGNGKTAVISASALRFAIDRRLGWDQVRSDTYQLAVRNATLVFDGQGHGHGVGLCQAGAAEMAQQGKTTSDILAFYFPGTDVRILPSDKGWQQIHAGTLTIQSTQALSALRQAALQQTWIDAQKLFPPRHSLSPTIVLAPSTEIFRQLTTQPGWTLASTRGTTVVLQPEAVLHANSRDEINPIRHEMLHVLVESECSDSSPLWLREGLVEVLDREANQKTNWQATNNSSAMPVNSIEDALQHPNKLLLSQRAHQAAAARVRSLITRYGSSTVRGWLSSGVPAGAS